MPVASVAMIDAGGGAGVACGWGGKAGGGPALGAVARASSAITVDLGSAISSRILQSIDIDGKIQIIKIIVFF
jgi:hypothetical protein